MKNFSSVFLALSLMFSVTLADSAQDSKNKIDRIIKHMNEDHTYEMEALLKKIGNVKNPKNVKLESVDYEGLDIAHSQGKLRVKFKEKATDETLTKEVMELFKDFKKPVDLKAIQDEIKKLPLEFKSVVLATLSKNGEVISSYAPVIHYKGKFFIYISHTGPHYDAIKSNPNNIDMMFVEDESKAKNILARKRLRYHAKARFVERDSKEFNAVYDQFIAQNGEGGGIKIIRTKKDFHMIELIPNNGRFIKAFGQIFDITNGKVELAKGEGHQESKSSQDKK